MVSERMGQTHDMTVRASAVLAILLTVAGCIGTNTSQHDPFPPGIAPNQAGVDPQIVAGRLMDAHEYDSALDAYDRAALQHGLTPEIRAGMGTARLQLGQLESAERLLRRAVTDAPDRAEFWNNLGVLLIEKRAYPEAAQVFRRAYALDNGESDAIRDNLRLALAKMQKPSYPQKQEQNYKLVRRGTSDYLIRKMP